MTELRRTKAGIFSENDKEFVNLYEFEKAVDEYKKGNEENLRKILIPGEVISKIIPVIQVKQDSLNKLLIGKPIFKEDIVEEVEGKEKESIAIFCGDRFVEIARLVKEGNIVAKPEFVLS